MIAHRGQKKELSSIPVLGGFTCILIGSFLSIITVANENSQVSLEILSECFQVRSEGKEPR